MLENFKNLNFNLKFLYIFRLSELDEVQRFRFIGTFFVALYMMIMLPVIKKYQGVFFTTQLITILLIASQLSNKFLEKVNSRFRIGQIYHFLVYTQITEILILFIYFYNFKLMIYLYSFFDIILAFIAMSYGIKLTSMYAKKYPKEFKMLPIFKQNIWAEGFIIGLFLSFGLQYLGVFYIICAGITLRIGILIYMLINYNFYDKYFEKEK